MHFKRHWTPKSKSPFLAVALLVGLPLVGCEEEPLPPRGDADVVGEIREVDSDLGAEQPEADILTKVLIRKDGEECGTIFSVTEETAIEVRMADGAAEQGSVEDLQVGVIARAWVEGDGVFTSCPAQARAERIELRS